MIAYFEDIGRTVDTAWTAAGRGPEALPDIAAAALGARPAHDHTSVAEVLSWVARVGPADFPVQGDVPAVFGDPPVTVFWGGDFRIDVNLWASSTTSIHQHAFAGAFQVLHGASLESRYAFAESRRVSEHLRVGELSLRDMRVRRVGDVSDITPGASTIHALFHLDHPSATVVVRSNGHEAYLPQLAYDPPGVAYDTGLDAVFGPLDHRRLQLVQLLSHTRHDSLDAILAEVLADADPLFAYQVLAATLPNALATQGIDFAGLEAIVDRWFEAVPWPDDALKRALRAGSRQRVRRWDVRARRSLLLEPDDRLIAAVLLNAPDRDAILAFVRGHFADVDPLDAVLGFIDRAYAIRDPGNPQICGLGVHESAVGVLRAMVADDLDFDGVMTLIASANPEVDVEAQREALGDRDAQLRHFGLFAAWFA